MCQVAKGILECELGNPLCVLTGEESDDVRRKIRAVQYRRFGVRGATVTETSNTVI